MKRRELTFWLTAANMAHGKRQSTAHFIPSSYVHLTEANAYAADVWFESERPTPYYTPPPPTEEIKAAAVETDEMKAVYAREMKAVYARLNRIRAIPDEAWGRLRQMLYAGDLTGYLLFPSGGSPWPIPAEYWSAAAFSQAYHCDQLRVEHGPNRLSGWPIGSRSELEAALGLAIPAPSLVATAETEGQSSPVNQVASDTDAAGTPAAAYQLADGNTGLGRFSPAKAEALYIKRVTNWRGVPPSRDDDARFMRERLGVPVQTTYDLRRKHAPEEWQKAGRRKQGDLKSG